MHESYLDEALIILLLVTINGFLSMSEMAIVSSKKSRLLEQSQKGNTGAMKAIELSESPTGFLSTIQTGITLVGIVSGVFGGVALAEGLANYLESFGMAKHFASAGSFFLVVSIITYLSIVFGELVPKRLALRYSETIAALVAGPVQKLSRLAGPIVQLLSLSTEAVVRLIGMKDLSKPSVSEDEIRILIEEGQKAGLLDQVEKEIVEEALELGDRLVRELMQPRVDIIWLDIERPWSENLKLMLDVPHNLFPVSRNRLDDLIGVVRIKDVFRQMSTSSGEVDLIQLIAPPLCISENKSVLWALDRFKTAKTHAAIVLDEYGGIQGMITINDIFESMVGALPDTDAKPKWEVVEREDGSFLIDGRMPIDEFQSYFALDDNADEDSFRTVGGLVLDRLQHAPKAGQTFVEKKLRIEVVDMDRMRVDKLLVTRIQEE